VHPLHVGFGVVEAVSLVELANDLGQWRQQLARSSAATGPSTGGIGQRIGLFAILKLYLPRFEKIGAVLLQLNLV
jgi:hypothetical protein